MKLSEQELFEKQQVERFVQERDEILKIVASLMENNGLSPEFLENFAIRLDRLVDIGRSLVINEKYLSDLNKDSRGKEPQYVDGVNLNALD